MGMVGAVRFSTDSKKLTFKSDVGKCIEVWDIESQKLDHAAGFFSFFWNQLRQKRPHMVGIRRRHRQRR
ncbi:hypothetical protein BDR03DRAFT_525021, partial [Suillus americanus]